MPLVFEIVINTYLSYLLDIDWVSVSLVFIYFGIGLETRPSELGRILDFDTGWTSLLMSTSGPLGEVS